MITPSLSLTAVVCFCVEMDPQAHHDTPTSTTISSVNLTLRGVKGIHVSQGDKYVKKIRIAAQLLPVAIFIIFIIFFAIKFLIV